MALKEKIGSHDLAHEGAVSGSRTLPAMEFHLLTCKQAASEIHCGQAVNGNGWKPDNRLTVVFYLIFSGNMDIITALHI